MLIASLEGILLLVPFSSIITEGLITSIMLFRFTEGWGKKLGVLQDRFLGHVAHTRVVGFEKWTGDQTCICGIISKLSSVLL